MAEVAAMAVSAAGSIAGGKAASALTDRNAPKGGGIPGLTTSVGGKKDGSQDAIQVDPTQALDYFKQASAAHEKGYNEGLSLYLPALDKASKQIQAGYAGSNATLKPLSTSSGEALNQQLRFLGLDPIQATAGFGDSLRTAGSLFGDTRPDATKLANELADQMDAASAIKDPTARAEAKANILGQMNNIEKTLNDPLQAKLDAISQPGKITDAEIKANIDQMNLTPTGYENVFNIRRAQADALQGNGAPIHGGDKAFDANVDKYSSEWNKLISDKKAAQTKYDTDSAAIKDQMTANTAIAEQLKPFTSQFDQQYGANYDRAFTGQEVADAVSNLPGFQFQYEQGTKGLERKAAAQGMLGSANTQLALQEYGQQQAQSYFNNYMQQLSGQVAQGTPATMGIAQNQTNQGNALGNLAQMYGAAQMDTARANADFLSNQLMASGQLFNQDAIFNAGQQNQAIQNSLQREADQKKAQTTSGAGYVSAQNQGNYQSGMLGLYQQQFNQQQQASRNYAQGYLYGGY